jgi:hypothetical protein
MEKKNISPVIWKGTVLISSGGDVDLEVDSGNLIKKEITIELDSKKEWKSLIIP